MIFKMMVFIYMICFLVVPKAYSASELSHKSLEYSLREHLDDYHSELLSNSISAFKACLAKADNNQKKLALENLRQVVIDLQEATFLDLEIVTILLAETKLIHIQKNDPLFERFEHLRLHLGWLHIYHELREFDSDRDSQVIARGILNKLLFDLGHLYEYFKEIKSILIIFGQLNKLDIRTTELIQSILSQMKKIKQLEKHKENIHKSIERQAERLKNKRDELERMKEEETQSDPNLSRILHRRRSLVFSAELLQTHHESIGSQILNEVDIQLALALSRK